MDSPLIAVAMLHSGRSKAHRDAAVQGPSPGWLRRVVARLVAWART
jgi:hypothetical protein